MTPKRRNPVQSLDRPAKRTVPIICTDAGMYAPDWDNPKTQMDRVVTKAEQPRLIDRGPSGFTRGK